MTHLDRLREWLLTLDEVQVCELLDVATEDIIDRFEDIIISRRKYLQREFEILPETDNEELDFDEE